MTKVEGELLRFFIYWRQQRQRTDYDLSALFLDEQYANPRQISWTRLSGGEAEHSGDITQVLDAVPDDGEPVTWIGLEQPGSLPAGSEVFTLDRLGDLIPA